MNLLLVDIMQLQKKEVECHKTYNLNKNDKIKTILDELKKSTQIKMKELEQTLLDDDQLEDDDEEEEDDYDDDEEGEGEGEGEEDEGEEEEK